jgi:hypothetical protein
LRPAWPDAAPVRNMAELARSLSDVRTLLDRQVVVWAPAETPIASLTVETSASASTPPPS